MDVFTKDDLAKGASGPGATLGPHYYSAQRVVADVMKGFEAEHLDPIIKAATDSFHDKLETVVRGFIWQDVESNLQSEMWRTVDSIVHGILSGEAWLMERYALSTRHDCEKVREAVAKHIGDHVAKARIKDLEARVTSLTDELKWYKGGR